MSRDWICKIWAWLSSGTIRLCPQVTLPFCKPTMLYNFFNWPSPLVGCGEVCGRSTTHFSQMVDPCTDLSSNIPRTKNLETVVAPSGGPRGERMRSGGGFVGSSGLPRASFEPRASFIVLASHFYCFRSSFQSPTRIWVILGLFLATKMRFLRHWPPHR